MSAVLSVLVLSAGCLAVFLFTFSCRDAPGAAANAGAASPAGSSESGTASAASGGGSSEEAPSSSVPASSVPPDAAGSAGEIPLLVNYDNRLPDGYRPNLVTAYGFQMTAETAEAYMKMHDAAAADGVSLWISSAYRSVERQEELFEREIDSYAETHSSPQEAEAYAEQSVARPGYSEHATGLALDLNGVRDDFDTTPSFRWLDAHAQDYGFILRYPKDKQEITKIKYEPWHYRYVGEKAARAMKEKGLCLEEYVDSLQKGGGAD